MKKKPQVLNIRRCTKEQKDQGMYVGRGSPWGNPFYIGKHGTRDRVCERFKAEILPTLDIRKLRGKNLICFCAPLRCHADDLLKKANGEET